MKNIGKNFWISLAVVALFVVRCLFIMLGTNFLLTTWLDWLPMREISFLQSLVLLVVVDFLFGVGARSSNGGK